MHTCEQYPISISHLKVSKYPIYTNSKDPGLPLSMCICSHVYLWLIWTTPGGESQTQSCQIYGPLWAAGEPGYSLVWLKHAAGVISLPVSSHVEETFISVETTGLQPDEYSLSVVQFLLLTKCSFLICRAAFMRLFYVFLLKWMWHLRDLYCPEANKLFFRQFSMQTNVLLSFRLYLERHCHYFLLL